MNLASKEFLGSKKKVSIESPSREAQANEATEDA